MRVDDGYEEEREYRWKRIESLCSVFTGPTMTAQGLNNSVGHEVNEGEG
jgi:hypothetical protein